MDYVILLRPNHGPGPLYVSAHGGGWSEALNFPWTTNQVRFAKRFPPGRDALAWVESHPLPRGHEYELLQVPGSQE